MMSSWAVKTSWDTIESANLLMRIEHILNSSSFSSHLCESAKDMSTAGTDGLCHKCFNSRASTMR